MTWLLCEGGSQRDGRLPCKLREVFRTFSALGVTAEPVVYSDAAVAAVRDQLLVLDGVLVWVNPIEQASTARSSTLCCARSPTPACG